jgi:hypothetical protein
LKCFEEWLATNYLPPISQLIMYKLISLFNSCGWKEWIVADNFYFMSICKVNSEKTFINWRDYLIKEGLIEYLKGSKNKPNKYKLAVNFTEKIKFTVNFTEKMGEKMELQGERKSNYGGGENGATGTDIPNVNLNLNRKDNNDIISHYVRNNILVKSQKIGTRLSGTNPRETGTSPRQLGVAPRQMGVSPKQLIEQKFEKFWDIYPKKVAKQSAMKAFIKISNLEATLEKILEGVERWKASNQWKDPQFIPYPTSFLNGRRWEDEITNLVGEKNNGLQPNNSENQVCTEFSEGDEPPEGLYDW